MQLQEKLKNKKISNILFIAPRYHTNQISVCKTLKKNGYNVEFFAKHFGKIEDYTVLKPKVFEANSFSKLLKRLFFLKKINIFFIFLNRNLFKRNKEI